MNFPIKLKKIIDAGGACPYQIEAETEQGEYFYLRYRGGRLRAGVTGSSAKFSHSKESYNVIDGQSGHHLNGSISEEEHRPLLEGKIIFPEGFKLQYDYYSSEQEPDPRDGLPNPQ